jgi:opacity protein-like surface antigen
MSSRVLLRRALLAACALGLLGAGTARAQYGLGGRALELSAFNGYHMASDIFDATGGAEIDLANDYIWGLRAGITPHSRFTFEFAYSSTSTDVSLIRAFQPVDEIGTLDLDIYEFNFLFQQPSMASPKVLGFFVLGLGWSESQLVVQGGQPYDSGAKFTWNMGLGAKIELNPNFLLRAQGAFRFIDTDRAVSGGVTCDIYGYCWSYASDIWTTGDLTLGLTYRFPLR